MPMTAMHSLRSAGAVFAIATVIVVATEPAASAAVLAIGVHAAPPPMLLHGFTGVTRTPPPVHLNKVNPTPIVILPMVPSLPGQASAAPPEPAPMVFHVPSGWVETENTLNHGTRPQKRALYAQLCKEGDESSCFMASAFAER
jgi:hypothetical protein